MAGRTENLIPNSQRTPEELREMTRKGGIRSGQVRRERKKFNELFNAYLDKNVANDKLKKQMLEFGFNDDECTNKNAMVFAQYREALKGSTQAFVAVRDTVGEKPKENINVTGEINNPYKELSVEELKKLAGG